MGGDERELVHRALSSLMVAEQRITTKFAGICFDPVGESPESCR